MSTKSTLDVFDKFINQFSNELSKTTIGLQPVLDGVRTALGTYDSYPPFNFEQFDEYHYRVTFALAGFDKEDITINVKDNWLAIEGSAKAPTIEEGVTPSVFHHRGIATRDFSRVIQLASDVVVKGAIMKDGLLNIELERIVPDEKKPQEIKIA